MSAPAFGDRVKAKVQVEIPRGETHEPGEMAIVVEVPPPSSPEGLTVRILFEGDEQPVRVPLDAVTTDMSWITPLEESIADRYAIVLKKEKCGTQDARVYRIARALLRAHAEGIELHLSREAERVEREEEARLAAEKERRNAEREKAGLPVPEAAA